MDAVFHTSKKMTFLTLLNIYLRSFFFQGSFSVKDRQNMGFAYCIEPVGRVLYKNITRRKEFNVRHLEFYNGNPFMITLVLGAVANMEERLRNNDGIKALDVSRFKTAVGKTTGSLGDRFFWRTLRPFGLVIGLLLAIQYGLWGILAFLAIFNVPTMYLKWHWLAAGYRLGPRIVLEIRDHSLDRISRLMETLGGLILAFLTVAFLSGRNYGLSWVTAGAIGLFVVSVILFKKRIHHSLVFSIGAGAAIVIGLFISNVL